MRKLYAPFIFALISGSVIGQTVSSAFFNSYSSGNTECLNNEQRSEIKQHIADNIAWLQSAGKLPTQYSQQAVLFDWPLKLRAGLIDYGYHSIAAQVDHDPAYPGQLLDYNCGMRTYDTPTGYNHAGTDYFLWPFDWNKMDSSDVEIIAAAGGTIVYKSDGYFDRSCGFNSNPWNAVYVQHADGSIAWYGHMKKGSLTTKTVGQTVAIGEYLGSVGSSGNSSGPHLHFEIYDAGGNLNDPYTGPCNSFNAFTWWNNQEPYVDAAINHIATNSIPPVFNPCSQEHDKNERDYFTNTDTIFLMLYYRFFSTGDSTLITIYRPNTTVWGSWWDVSSWPSYNAAYLYYWAILGSSEPNGQWKFEATYKNQTYFHYFWIGPSGINDLNGDNNFILSPNPSSGVFTLSFSPSFSSSSIEIYNVLGKQVYKSEMKNETEEIDLGKQQKGVYFVRVVADTKTYSQKLVIQ